MYYSSSIIYRYFLLGDNVDRSINPKRLSRNIEKRVEISKEQLIKCEEIYSSSPKLLEKWLRRNELPPDGYESPYDPKSGYDPALLDTMQKEIIELVTIKRVYASIQSDSNCFEALDAMKKIFSLDETSEDQLARYVHLFPYAKDLDTFGYTDEIEHFLHGFCPERTNNIAIAKILCLLWAHSLTMHGWIYKKPLYAIQSRAYNFKDNPDKEDTAGKVDWWNTIYGLQFARSLFYESIRSVDLINIKIEFPAFYWQDVISEKEQKQAGPQINAWSDLSIKLRKEVLHDIYIMDKKMAENKIPAPDAKCSNFISGPVMLAQLAEQTEQTEYIGFDKLIKQYLRAALDDLLNFKLKNLHYQMNTLEKKQILLAENIVTVMYVNLAQELQSELQYRKCALCDRYFLVGNRPTRKYCDIHAGPNASYFRQKHKKMLELVDLARDPKFLQNPE